MAIPFSRPRPIDIIAWALLAVAVIFAVFVRVRLREFALERDEGEFAYAGQLLLDGIPPYKLAYNMKLPGTYIAYAALMAVFGQTIAGIHLGLLAVNVATILLLYRLTRELFEPISAGLAAMFYAIMSVSPGVLGMAAHATHFVAFFGLAGVFLLWRHLQSGRWWSLLASGLLLGTAFLMKQQGVFLMVFGGAAIAVHTVVGLVKASRQSLPDARSRLTLLLQAAAFYAVAVLPYGLVCLWLWRAGVFDTFWFWTVTYAREYVAEIPLAYAWQSFSQGEGANVVMTDRIGWLAALTGCVAVVARGWTRPGRSAFVLGFLFCSFLCICPGFFFRSHYFIAMLPAVAMLAGVGCGEFLHLASLWKPPLAAAPAAAMEAPGRRRKPRLRPALERPVGTFAPLVVPAALLVLVAVTWPVWDREKRWFFFEVPAKLACRLIYSGNPFFEAPEISQYLNDHMAADDTLAVLGSEPEIPFYSRRRSATGYIYTYGLMEDQPLAETMQKEMEAEIERKNPKFILVIDARCSWLYQPKLRMHLHEWANRYLREKYEVVGLVQRPSRVQEEPLREISYRWSESGRNETPIAQWVPNDRGEPVTLAWLGVFEGIQPNPFASECTVWVCRRKP